MSIFIKLLSSVKDSYLPALIVLIASFFCALHSSVIEPVPLSLNITFFVCSFLNFSLLIFIKDFKNTFLMLMIMFLYSALAKIMQTPLATPYYFERWLMLIVPLNLFLISFIRYKQKHAFYFLCFFLIQATLIENLCLLNHAVFPDFAIPLSNMIWAALFIYLLISISAYPSIKNSSFFFECLLIFGAIFNFQTPQCFLICLFCAMLSDLLTNIHKIIYNYFRDDVTGCYSKNAFPALDPKKLPPKYTIAFFCIDNYHKILQVFKKNLTDKLTVMVLKRIKEIHADAQIYRLKDDEFCFIFFEQDIKQTFETVENMRRLIAGTEFVLRKNKVIKLTITPVVSEKHRNDANAAVVLERMHQNFDRRYKFTQNMTFCEELEQKKIKRSSSK